MKNGTKQMATRCVFCNSLSHKMTNCNSNMNGRREYLDQGWDCMMHSLCPDFNSLRSNELRYVAYHYVQYTGAVHSSDCKTSQHYNRKYGLNPIPLSFSKTKMVNELVRRWHAFGDVRALSTTPPEQPDDDCPICLESMTSYKWSNNIASWKLVLDKKFTTVCNHSFCKSCFNTHIERNCSVVHDCRNGSLRCVDCPYCRRKLHYH
jgi:hypothetical protein